MAGVPVALSFIAIGVFVWWLAGLDQRHARRAPLTPMILDRPGQRIEGIAYRGKLIVTANDCVVVGCQFQSIEVARGVRGLVVNNTWIRGEK